MGWARYFSVPSTYKESTTLEVADSLSSTTYSPGMKGMILRPDLDYMASTDMDLADFTYTGDFGYCHPPGTKKRFIHAYNCAADAATVITSQSNLPAVPDFAMQFIRTPTPPVGQTTLSVQWQLQFGGTAEPYIFQWGLATRPRFIYPDGRYEEYIIDEGMIARYMSQHHCTLDVKNFEGDLYLHFSPIGKPWIIHDIGALPSAPFTITSTGNAYAFNLLPTKYATTGTFYTDWIDARPIAWPDATPYPADPPDGYTSAAYPDPTAPCAVEVGWHAATSDDARKRFKVTLTGDGWHTPVVQGWQIGWDPEDAPAPTEHWLDISAWFAGGSEQQGMEVTARTANITLLPYKVVATTLGEMTLWEYVNAWLIAEGITDMGNDLRGNFALRYRTGYVYDDDSYESIIRMAGLVIGRDEARGVTELSPLTLSVYDRGAAALAQPLFHCPTLMGMGAGDAIAKLANWAGIPLAEIVVHAGANDHALEVPDKQFDKPRFLENDGTAAGSAIKKLCDRYDLVACYWPTDSFGSWDPKFHILPATPTSWPAPVATYTCYWDPNTSTAPDYWNALKKLEMRTDHSGMENIIVVKGWKLWRAADQRDHGVREDHERGVDITVTYQDDDSLYASGTDRYRGYLIPKLITEDDVHSPTGLAEIAELAFQHRRGGWPTVSLEGPGLWRRIARFDYIRLIDFDGIGDYYGQIEGVSVQMKPYGPYQATAQVRLLGPYSSFFP
jgi:hypothetical protein